MKNLLGYLISLGFVAIYVVVGLGISCVLAIWLCDIEPYKTYTWYSGIWQGLFCIPNWIRSLFYDDVLCKANTYTAGYNIWWWIVFIWTLLAVVIGGKKARS